MTRCYPGRPASGRGDRTPTPREQDLCAFWRDWELELLRPELIVTVGGLALRRMLGIGTLTDAIGKSFTRRGRDRDPAAASLGRERLAQRPREPRAAREGADAREARARAATFVRVSDVPYRRTFVRLLGFLRPYRWSLLVSTILAVLSQAAAIAIVLLVGEAIDGIEAGRGTAVLAWLVVAISVVGILKAALMLGRRIISGRQALGIEKDMREALYAHLLRLSFGFYDRHQTGQLMSRATVDLQSVRFFLGFGLIFFFQHALTVVSVMVVLFVVEWRLALIALAITPVIVAVAYRYSHVSHPVLREVQQKLGDVATVTEESIVGVHVVKAFAQEERRQAQFERASGAVFEQTVRAFRQRALYVPLLSFLPLLAQGAVLLAAGRMVVNGSLGAVRVLRLQPAARDADRAAAQPRDVGRAGTAGDGVRRADLRGDGRARRRRRPPRRRRAAARPGRDPLRAVSPSATRRAGPCSRRSTSSSRPAGRSR